MVKFNSNILLIFSIITKVKVISHHSQQLIIKAKWIILHYILYMCMCKCSENTEIDLS